MSKKFQLEYYQDLSKKLKKFRWIFFSKISPASVPTFPLGISLGISPGVSLDVSPNYSQVRSAGHSLGMPMEISLGIPSRIYLGFSQERPDKFLGIHLKIVPTVPPKMSWVPHCKFLQMLLDEFLQKFLRKLFPEFLLNFNPKFSTKFIHEILRKFS